MNSPSLGFLSSLVTGRSTSHFADDLEHFREKLKDSVEGKRILAIGGAGSIGRATTLEVLRFNPAGLHVVDINENALADLARDLRNAGMPESIDFRALPIDFGSEIMRRYLSQQVPFDVVLNFAALKHVRSEKDVFSLLQMLDTNVVKQARFKSWLTSRGGCKRYFAVSTDKAANPTSLMGASKRIMEDVIFGVAKDPAMVVTTARFANVAFSNGSLLQAFHQRLQQRQPLAVPGDTRRYFVSMEEAGQICLMTALLGQNGSVYFPDLDPESSLISLEQVAKVVLHEYGFDAKPMADEQHAIREFESLVSIGQWPVIVTALNTSGEKPFEEFVGRGESFGVSTFKRMRCLSHIPGAEDIEGLCGTLERWVGNHDEFVTKNSIVQVVAAAVPNLGHVETGKSLDDRL